MNAKPRHFALGVIIILMLFALFTVYQRPERRSVLQDMQYISISQFLNDVDQGKIQDVVIQGQDIHGSYVDGHRFHTYAPNDPTLFQHLYGKEGLVITARPTQDDVPWFVSLVVSWLPFLSIIALWIWGLRRINLALRTPDGRSMGQVVDECGVELKKLNDRLEQQLNKRRDASEQR